LADVFISYAHSTGRQARAAAAALKAAGHSVWLDDDLPAHRAFSPQIEAQLTAAKAVLVLWSADAAASDWVLSEANRAREDRKLVQLSLDGARLPMPFDQIQCVGLAGWSGDADHPGWRKLLSSIAELVGGTGTQLAPAPAAPPALPDKPSIAVTPFASLSDDPEQQYFADGMVEEIIAALCRFKSIFVIGSGATFSFKGRTVSPQEVGAQLGVRYVLEGSVRRAANRVRIAVKLTDAADSAQIWADRFEDTLEDVFALQDRVALGVAGVIEPTVREAEIRRAAKRPTENMGSYDLYLRALALNASGALQNMPRALELLERAIALDPGHGPALAQAASLNAVLALRAQAGDRTAHRERCLALMQQALQAAGDDPSVLGAVASARIVLGRDAASTLPMVERALALNPGSAEAWAHSGRLRIALGEAELAAEHIEMAMRLDPLSQTRFQELADLGCARLLQLRFDEAIGLFGQSIELRPSFAPCHAWMASALGHVGRLAEARDALARFDAIGVGSVDAFAQRRFHATASRAIFLEGIALARGEGAAAVGR
jgi:adenylate cyclase